MLFDRKIRFCLNGFTLIELLVVIAITGILASGVLVTLNPVKRMSQAQDARIKSDMSALVVALGSYYAINGKYPKLLSDLVDSGDIKSIPAPPKSASYTYVSRTSGGSIMCFNGPTDPPCDDVRLYDFLAYPAVSGNVWCWRSTTGIFSETTSTLCSPASGGGPQP